MKEELKEKDEQIKKISAEIIEKHKKNDRTGKEEKAENDKLECLEKKADKIL
jgi:hypothetical protein